MLELIFCKETDVAATQSTLVFALLARNGGEIRAALQSLVDNIYLLLGFSFALRIILCAVVRRINDDGCQPDAARVDITLLVIVVEVLNLFLTRSADSSANLIEQVSDRELLARNIPQLLLRLITILEHLLILLFGHPVLLLLLVDGLRNIIIFRQQPFFLRALVKNLLLDEFVEHLKTCRRLFER